MQNSKLSIGPYNIGFSIAINSKYENGRWRIWNSVHTIDERLQPGVRRHRCPPLATLRVRPLRQMRRLA